MEIVRQFERSRVPDGTRRRGLLYLPRYKPEFPAYEPDWGRPPYRRFEHWRRRWRKLAAFSWVQNNSSLTSGNVTSASVTLSSAPGTGHLVCVAVVPETAITSMTAKDGNSNAYTVTPNSPSTNVSGAGQVWLAYLLSAPASASATITASWTTATASVSVFAAEFSYSGTASFDTDVAAYSTTSSTTINTPSITGAAVGELLFSAAAAGGTISAPANGSTLGSWTGAGPIAAGDQAEYILSSSGSATAVDYTQSSGTWSAMAMAIKAAAAFQGDEDLWAGPNPAQADPAITVWQ
jgi:hypothetical protein